jgi:hypothetical protein
MKRFGVMLDCSRNAVMKPEQVKKMASILKDFGYNSLQLYTEDTYEVEGEPFFGYLRGRYSVAELQDIVSYCQGIGMEVIPCVQALAHLNSIFRWPAYGAINDIGDILLVEEERTYGLIENIFKTLRKCFSSEYLHIGMDEAHLLGLGRYLDKHGYKNRFDILNGHLNKVIEIAKRYGFKPIMWSDMFLRLANQGAYYPENPVLTEECKRAIPQGVGLVYWDYYHTDKEYYTKMMQAHKASDNEVWFAGGAWTWAGFASCNQFSLQSMFPAMQAAKDCGIENVFLTMWGDNGKECSFYTALPSLYAIKRMYDGENDMDKIKSEFENITGESFDAMMSFDNPNFVAGNTNSRVNISKYMLYSDPFLGFLDVTVKSSAKAEYEGYAAQFLEFAKGSKYAYLYESYAALCRCLAIKYDLGVRTRKAYQEEGKQALLSVASDYEKLLSAFDVFYDKFQTLWFTENKPHGFDVQDLRLGGLKQRLISCHKRLLAYCKGEIENIPELEETLLLGEFGDRIGTEGECVYNHWSRNATVNVL